MLPISDDPLWSADRVAAYFQVDKQTVIRWINEDGLVANKMNNRWKIKQSDVYAYRDRKFAEGAKK